MTTPESQRVVPVELLPCPFCGGQAECVQRGSFMEDIPYVCCRQCRCFQDAEELDVAIAAWNRRAPAASPPVAPLAAAQEGVSVGVRAKPLQFKGAEYADGSKEWDDSDMGFHIGFDPDEEDGERYRAACGEGESETFATLEEAKEWCQSEADKWVRKVAYSHPPAQTQGVCETCNGHGLIGGHYGQTPESFGYHSEDCPDCTQKATPSASPEDRRDGERVGPDDVLWVVNDMGELGVKIHGRCFFHYKGESLEYADGTGHDDGTPTLYREVGKREFGETVWPQAWIKAGRSEARYNLELVYTPGLSDGEPGDPRYQWAPLPVVAAIDSARGNHEGV